jgi:hypothetical protein
MLYNPQRFVNEQSAGLAATPNYEWNQRPRSGKAHLRGIFLERSLVKADNEHFFREGVLLQVSFYFFHRYSGSSRDREAVCTGADRRKGDVPDPGLSRKFERMPVAIRQEAVFFVVSPSPDRTNRMDNPLGRKAVASS